MTDTVTDADKLACAKRELAMRKRAYPRWIEAGRISKERADREIEVMQAIVDDYAKVMVTRVLL